MNKTVKIGWLILSLTWIFSAASQAWDYEYVLPPHTADLYTPAAVGKEWHAVNFSCSSQNQPSPMRPLLPGQTLRFKILAPPGTVEASIYGESNQWQGQASSAGSTWKVPGTYPLVGSFYYDGAFCLSSGDSSNCNGQPGSFVHPSQLHPVWGGLNEPIYDRHSNPMIKEARYLYFVLYHQPQAAKPFRFNRLNIGLLIQDTKLYNAWRQTAKIFDTSSGCPGSYPIPSAVPNSQSWRDWTCCPR